MSSEKRIFRCLIEGGDLYEPNRVHRESSISLSQLMVRAGLPVGPREYYDHIGDLGYASGLVFAPIRRAKKQLPHLIVALTEDLNLVAWAKLQPSAGDMLCAVHPWNRLLYVMRKDRSEELEAYRIDAFFAAARDIPRSRGREVPMPRRDDAVIRLSTEDRTRDRRGGQGIAFSANGRLYVPRSFPQSRPVIGQVAWDNRLSVYNALTGVRLDSPKKFDFKGWGDEIEGIDVHPSGVLYVAVAENDPSGDEFELHAFRYRGLQGRAV